MMLLLFFLAMFALVSASCIADPTPTPPIITAPAPTQTTTPVHDGWYEFTSGGVLVRIQAPPDWEAMIDDYGILLAEHSGIAEENIEPDGMLVYIFIPDMKKLDVKPRGDANSALEVLKHVANSRHYIGDATVSEPTGFTWHEHHAAYYLLSSKTSSRTMVLAVALPGDVDVVVANISAPAEYADHIREVVPVLLDSLTVNGVRLGSEALAALPDPLEFPPPSAEITPEATSPMVE